MDELIKNQQVVEECDKLLHLVSCDFVGLAFQNKVGPDVRWHYAIGNRNDKYQRIAVRYGKGIAGRVISTGRSIIVDDFPNHIQGKVLEYPIMLAENLVSAYAVPLFCNGIPRGVLLVGRRAKYPFIEKKQLYVDQSAKNLEGIVTTLMKL
ncbi:GAF domain-containing protein [Bacillus songklensis]|uniref:GAF domain-containing protein n=1 Tax=Bacillus songklensis TaxID=1069116 RepID=A0ABV8B2S9_9BACI